MGSKLRRASREAVKRYEEDDDYVVCRTELTRGEMNELFRYLPTPSTKPDGEIVRDKETVEQGAIFLKQFFKTVVRAWSLEEVDGTPVPVTPEAYDELTFESSQFVDGILNEHFAEIMKTKNAEGESTS